MARKTGRLGVGLVGSGFMGRAHAFAFGAVAQVFDLPLRPELLFWRTGAKTSRRGRRPSSASGEAWATGAS
jgi:hypothetical protein